MMQKILLLGLFLFCGGFFKWGACDAAPSPLGLSEEEMLETYFIEFTDCSLFPSEFTEITDHIEVAANISCDSDKMLVIPRGSSIMMYAEDDMDLKGVHFFIARGARLTLVAGSTITLARAEDSMEKPVVEVHGELYFFAANRFPFEEWIDEVFVPQGQQTLVKKVGFGAAVYSEEEVVFTSNAIVVGAPADETSGGIHAQATESEGIDTTEREKTDESMDQKASTHGENEGTYESMHQKATTHDENEQTDESVHQKATTHDADTMTERLKVGDVLRDESLQLTSGDRAFKLWAGNHGSLMFAEYLAEKQSKKDVEALKDIEPITLIPASNAKVKGMLKFRAVLQDETAAEGDPNVGSTKSGRAWTPWGIRNSRRLDKARVHAGEVGVTVDRRGCVEVSVDGSCVLSRSGQYDWEWVNKCSSCVRRKSSEYELHVVDDGMQVKLEGRKVWGVTVPKGNVDKSGERTVFGITAADIE